MKKNLAIFHQYATQSGFGMDARGVVTAAPSVLNAYYAAHSGALQFANAPLAFYEELLELFNRKLIILPLALKFNIHSFYLFQYLFPPLLWIGDIATGEFATSSVAQVRPSMTEKRSLSDEEDSAEISIPAPASVTTEIVSP